MLKRPPRAAASAAVFADAAAYEGRVAALEAGGLPAGLSPEEAAEALRQEILGAAWRDGDDRDRAQALVWRLELLLLGVAWRRRLRPEWSREAMAERDNGPAGGDRRQVGEDLLQALVEGLDPEDLERIALTLEGKDTPRTRERAAELRRAAAHLRAARAARGQEPPGERAKGRRRKGKESQ